MYHKLLNQVIYAKKPSIFNKVINNKGVFVQPRICITSLRNFGFINFPKYQTTYMGPPISGYGSW